MSGARSEILPTNTVVAAWKRFFYNDIFRKLGERNTTQTFSLSADLWEPFVGIAGGGVDI